ncbi:hypothetical protein EYF80_027691 [Liparis tanakae]|uniref:Uncharacterized protein n=1 Tax=Liparis tanakae TaxID=230148 RepID=A0A4Z2H8F1_9TELE|nr:hypothetical protein EYF80_027691 [Liparis tanakae]
MVHLQLLSQARKSRSAGESSRSFSRNPPPTLALRKPPFNQIKRNTSSFKPSFPFIYAVQARVHRRRHPDSAPRHSTWFRGQHRLLKLIQLKDERTGFCRPDNVCSFKVQVNKPSAAPVRINRRDLCFLAVCLSVTKHVVTAALVVSPG